MNGNAHIENFLDYYISLESSPDYAVMLRGKWGSGKSWFIQNYIDNKKNKKSKNNFLYVSLYGVTSFKDIEDSFFEQTHPILATKGMKIAGKIMKGLLKATIHVDLNSDGTQGGSLRPEFPEINLPDYLKGTDKKIIIFDDLERCSMEIHNILGYINQFVENNGSKVIIIANEDQIIEMDAVESNNLMPDKLSYRKIKEKVVGKSFTILPDFFNAFENFIKFLDNDEVKILLSAKKHIVEDFFSMSTYKNLRHLKQILLDFGRFYKMLPESATKKPELIDSLLSIFFALSYEIKSGALTEDKLSTTFGIDAIFEHKNNEKSLYSEISSKYGGISFQNTPIPLHLWEDFFKLGTINSKILATAIENSIYFQDENTPAWKKLWRYFEIDDEIFDSLYKQVFSDFKNMLIEDQYIVLQITGMLTYYSDIKLINIPKKEIIAIGIKNIKNLESKKLLYYDYVVNSYHPNVSYGLEYHGIEIVEFKKFLSDALEKFKESQIDTMPNIAFELLELVKSSSKDFDKKMTLLRDVSILNHIDASEFTEALMSLNNQGRVYICQILEKRYSYISLNSILVNEKKWLITVKKQLAAKLKLINKNKKLLRFNINDIVIPSFENIINRLETTTGD